MKNPGYYKNFKCFSPHKRTISNKNISPKQNLNKQINNEPVCHKNKTIRIHFLSFCIFKKKKRSTNMKSF